MPRRCLRAASLMAAVDRGGSGAAPEPSPTNAARSVEASKLLDMFTAAKPMNPDAFVPESACRVAAISNCSRGFTRTH